MGGVQRLVGGQRVTHILNSNVSVTNNLTLPIELLGSGVVSVVSVSKGTSLEVVDLDLDIEILVGGEVVVVLRVDQNARHHVLSRRDLTHSYGLLVAITMPHHDGISTYGYRYKNHP